ncbi:MAG: type II toxin-antitoxin system Phd/YefM family antitoxin [Cellulomonas sp.]
MTTVGVSEARAHFARLLGRVALGEAITITRRGVAVAMLVAPCQRPVARDDVLRELDEIAEGVNLGDLSIWQLIVEGRR